MPNEKGQGRTPDRTKYSPPGRGFVNRLRRSGPRLVCGHRLWVAGMHLPAGAYLIVVSNRPAQQALEVYKRRWHIEVLFEALKSRGFNFTL